MNNSVLPQASLRVSVAGAIPEVLRSLGHNADRIFLAAGVPITAFDDPDASVAYSSVGHILGLCVRQTGCKHFGLLVGGRATLATLGIAGYIARSSATAGEGLANFVSHLRLQDRGAVVTLKVDGDHAILSYSLDRSRAEHQDQIQDAAMALAHRMLRELCGEGWRAQEVLLAHRKPADVTPFRAFFQAPIRFDTETSGLVFGSEWLARLNPFSEPPLLKLLLDRAKELEAVAPRSFADEVRSTMRPLLLQERCTAQTTAAAFQIASRSLSRRLGEEGTDFRTLLEEIRFDVASQLLKNTEIALVEIAAALAYSDPSAFSRAFRRWCGVSPRDWRATQKATRHAE